MGKSEQQHLQLSSSVDTMVREVMTSHDPAAAVRHSKFWYTKLTCFWRTRTELEAFRAFLLTMQTTKQKSEAAPLMSDASNALVSEADARPLNARELSLYKRVVWRSSMSATHKSLAVAADTSTLRARLMLDHIRRLEAASQKTRAQRDRRAHRRQAQQQHSAPLMTVDTATTVKADTLAAAPVPASRASRIPRSPRTPQRATQAPRSASLMSDSPRDLPPALYAYSGLPHPICLSSTFEGAGAPIIMPVASAGARRPPSSGAQSRISRASYGRRTYSTGSIVVDRELLASTNDEATRAWNV